MGRIIKPMEIEQQVQSIISAVDKDKYRLSEALIETHAFISCDELQGNAWDSTKTQFVLHGVVIRGLLCMLDEVILAGNELLLKCGEKDFDEDKLIEQLRMLQLNIFIHENTLYKYQSKKASMVPPQSSHSSTYPYFSRYEYAYVTEYEYYGLQILKYLKLIENEKATYQAIEEEIARLDEIDLATRSLNEKVEQLRAAAIQGITFLKSTWNDATACYAIPIRAINTSWINTLSIAWTKMLKQKKNALAAELSDAQKIELSRQNGKTYLSNDKQSLIYGGQLYEIYVPEYYETIDDRYEVVASIKKDDIYFSFSEALFNVKFESPNLQTVYSGNQTIYKPRMNGTLGSGIVFDALIGAFEKGINRVDIKIDFLTTKGGQNRLALIYAGSYDQRTNAQNIDYRNPISLYLKNFDNLIARNEIIDVAYNIYNEYMGGEVKKESLDIYDIRAVLSEKRLDAWYSSYLSFDENGNVMETPIRYKGERVYITRGKRIAFSINETEVLDITDMAFKQYSVPSEDYSALISTIIEDELNAD